MLWQRVVNDRPFQVMHLAQVRCVLSSKPARAYHSVVQQRACPRAGTNQYDLYVYKLVPPIVVYSFACRARLRISRFIGLSLGVGCRQNALELSMERLKSGAVSQLDRSAASAAPVSG